MSNRKSYFNGELGQRFGYRKLTVGLCSVVLGSFLLTTNNQQVKADMTNDSNQTEKATTNADSSTQPEAKQASVVEETTPQTASNSAPSTANTSSDANKSASVNDATINNSAPSISNNNQTQNAIQTNQQANNVKQNVQNTVAQNGVATTNQASQVSTQNTGDKSAQNNTQVNNQETNANSVQQNNGNSTQKGATTGETNSLDVTKNNNAILRANVLTYSEIADVQSQKNKYTKSSVTNITEISHQQWVEPQTHATKQFWYGRYHIKYNRPDGISNWVDAPAWFSPEFKDKFGWDDRTTIDKNGRVLGGPGVNASDKLLTNWTSIYEPTLQGFMHDHDAESLQLDLEMSQSINADKIIVDKPGGYQKVIDRPASQSQDLAFDFINNDSNDKQGYGHQIGGAVFKTGNVGNKASFSLVNTKPTDDTQIQIPDGFKLANGQSSTINVTYVNSTAPQLIYLVRDPKADPSKRIYTPSNVIKKPEISHQQWTDPKTHTINQYWHGRFHIKLNHTDGSHSVYWLDAPTWLSPDFSDKFGWDDRTTIDKNGHVIGGPGHDANDKEMSDWSSLYKPTWQGYLHDHDAVSGQLDLEQSQSLNINKVIIDKAGGYQTVIDQPAINNQEVAFDFIDSDPSLIDTQNKDAQIGDAVFKTGKVGDTYNFTIGGKGTGDNFISIPAGYKLADTQDAGITLSADKTTATISDKYADSTAPKLIHLVHITDDVGPISIPTGVDPSEFTHTVTRTVNIKDSNGTTLAPVTQKVTFTRTGKYDEATKKMIDSAWGKWTLDPTQTTSKSGAQFDAVKLDPPAGQYAHYQGQTDQIKDGDTLNQISVQTGITDASQNVVLNVVYSADPTHPIEGEITTGAKINTKTYTRTINVTDPDGKISTVTQTIKFHRNGTENTLTHEITWDPTGWQQVSGDGSANGTFNAYTPTTNVDGYNTPTVVAQTVNPDTMQPNDIQPVSVSYTAKERTGSYHFVDDDNNGSTVGSSSTPIIGKTDQAITLPTNIPTNYELVPNQVYKFGRNNDTPNFSIHLRHKRQDVSDTDNQNVERSSATRTINVTINRPASAGGVVTHKYVQVIGLKRSWVKDLVTGKEISHGDWETDDGYCEFNVDGNKTNNPAPKAYIISGGNIYFATVNLPDVPGYAPENPQVEQSKDSIAELALPYMTTMSFMFMPSTQHVTYHFLDQDNNNAQVGTITKDGITDDTGNFTLTAPDGYDFTVATDANQAHKFTPNDNSIVNINVVHHIVKGITQGQYGTNANDFSRTVKRTLHVTNPDNTTKDDVQSHTFTRTADYDAAKKQVIWHAWSDDGKFTFTMPTDIKPVDGYTLTNIPDEDITPDTGDTSLDVYYEPVEQHVTINYVDDQGKTIKSIVEKGGTGSKIDLSKDMPENWQGDGKQDMNYTFTPANSQDVTVKIGHILDAKDPESRTITRKVTIYLPDGTIDQAHSTTQSTTFTRAVNFDRVLGHDVYGVWSKPQTFDTITGLKDYDGFDTPSVPAVTVTGDSSSSTLDLHYKARGQNITIYYNDADTGKTITSSTLNGKTDQTIDIAYKAPDHWHITNQKDLPTSHKFTAKDDLTIIAKIAHDLTANGTDSKTISRHIEIDVPGGDPKTVDQTVTFTRPKYTDDVDGTTKYGDWSENGKHTFDKFDVPTVPGYVTNGSVPAITVTPDSKNPNEQVKITYIAGGQTGSYRFVDDDRNQQQVGSDYQIAGKTNDTIKLDYTIPDGYQLDNSFTAPGSYTFHDGTNAPAIIHLKHALVDANDDPNAETSRTFNRNIMITNPDGKGMNAQQSVTFTRKAQKDAVTGKYVYGAWSNGGVGKFDEYDIKPRAGYTIVDLDTGKEISKIDAMTINADETPQSTNKKIGYKAEEQKAYWYFVDDDAKQPTDAVKALEQRHEIDGKTGERVPLNIQLPANYHVVSVGYADTDGLAIQLDAVNSNDSKDVKIPTEYTFAGTGNKTLVIHLGHNKSSVSTANGDNGVDDSRTITRTIILNNPNSKDTTETQKVTFTRTASKDLVDGTITYGDWSNGGKQTMPALKVPAVPGYSSDQKDEEIPEITVTPDSKPSSITVHYNANDGQQTIVYVGSDGKELGRQIVKGKTDEEVPFTPNFPDGYTNKEVPNTIKIPAVDKPLTMTVEPKVTTVHIDPNHPIEEGQVILGTDIKAPKGLGKDDLNKDITRHVVISLPDGTNKTIDQTVHAQRGATIDLTTKKITYDPWKVVGKDSFDPIKVPTVDGYTPSIREIPGVEHVDPNKDYGNALSVKVTYTKSKAEKKVVDNGGGNGNGGYVDNSNSNVTANTDPTLNSDGKFNGLNTDYMKNNTVDVKAGKVNIKRYESTKLSKVLLKNGKHVQRNGNKRGVRGNGCYGRGYDYGAGYGNGMNANGYGTDNSANDYGSNGYGAGAGGMNANGNSAGNSNDANSSANVNGAMSGVDSVASGQYDSLPQTGNAQNYAVFALGLAAISLSFGLVGTRRKRG